MTCDGIQNSAALLPLKLDFRMDLSLGFSNGKISVGLSVSGKPGDEATVFEGMLSSNNTCAQRYTHTCLVRPVFKAFMI